MMRKILLVVWVVSLACLLFIIGNILMHGSTVDRKSLAEDIGIIWGLSFGGWSILALKARQ